MSVEPLLQNDNENNNIIIDELLIEFRQQREDLKKLICDLEELKVKVDKLFPETLDKRFMRFFEEKVKTATGLFNSILDIRKEVTKSLKDEIEIRRKIVKTEDDEFNDLDIQNLADRVEKLNKYKQKKKQNLEMEQSDG